MPQPPAPVLYVEDEENDAFLMQLAFERAGVAHPLHVVPNGLEALHYLHRTHAPSGATPPPALILLDLNLPQMNGFEVLQRVRADPHVLQLPVVIFSSSEQPPDKARARELGANDYIVKPGRLEDFVAVAVELKRTWLTAPRAIG